jgi:hypothetical protein
MKIRFYSDLHLEFGNFTVPDPEPDTVLILAGDIGVKLSALSFIEKNYSKFKAVVYVLGNHEFYNGNMNDVLTRWRNVTHIPNLHFLENDSVVIDNIRILGCTLWTDMNNDDFAVKAQVGLCMNDYKIIRVGKETYNKRGKIALSPSMTVVLHKESLDFLNKELESSNQKTLVVTHHSPIINGVNSERYGTSMINYAYYTPLEYLMDKHDHLTHWIFGHTHKSLDMDVYGTRVLSNPRGYVGHDQNESFNPKWDIEV